MRLKKDFRNRLIALRNSINSVLSSDSYGFVRFGNLFPHLASVYRYLWFDLESKVSKK